MADKNKAAATKTAATAPENGAKITSVADVVQNVSEKSGVERSKVKAVLEAYAELAAESLKTGDSIPLVGIGKLKATTVAAREGRNPANGETIQIAEKRRISVSAGKAFKDGVQ